MATSAADDLLLSLGLPASTCPRYEYHSVDDFLSVLDKEFQLFKADNTRSQYIAFSRVTASVFGQNFDDLEHDLLRFESYFPRLDLLLVKMALEPHDAAVAKFGDLLMKKLIAMNDEELEEELERLLTSGFRTMDRKKRADDSFRPVQPGTSPERHWPSVVVEVGFSEPYRKLKEDARWWLTASNNEVKNVVVISINPRYREMVIEKWIDQGEPIKEFRTVLSREATGQKINTSNAQPLIIRFNDLFLRMAGPKEHDITFSVDDWEKLARRVWRIQFETDYRQMA